MSEPGGASGIEIAAVVTAGGGVLAIIGHGLSWLLKFRRSRMGRLEDRLGKIEKSFTHSVRQCDCLVSVVIILLDDASDHSKATAKALIGTEFPELMRRTFHVNQNTPKDMQDVLDMLDRVPR